MFYLKDVKHSSCILKYFHRNKIYNINVSCNNQLNISATIFFVFIVYFFVGIMNDQNKSSRVSDNWQNMMRLPNRRSSEVSKFNKLKLKAEKVFCTGSKYEGQWNALGMSGEGEYTMFYDVEHSGGMKDGTFHGPGYLTFPNGARMEGEWENGHMISHNYIYADDMKYDAAYCQMPDRRFLVEIREGLQPAGNSYLTNDKEPRPIPEDCYDVGDGFYNPKRKCVIDVADNTKILRIPTKTEHEWIIRNCRKAWDEPAGFRPDLFENWHEGNKKSCISSTSTFSDI